MWSSKEGRHIMSREYSGRVLDSRLRGRGFEPHRRHCIVSLSKNINPSLVLVQPRKTRPLITDRLLMGRKESNQTNKNHIMSHISIFRNFWELFCRHKRLYLMASK